MIVALIVMTLMWWGHRVLFRRMGFQRAAMTMSAPVHRTGGTVRPLGLEDDPDQWHALRGAWTALDELQLTRLLGTRRP